jgi:3',5'-cyclic-AMP phosphodiesterase
MRPILTVLLVTTCALLLVSQTVNHDVRFVILGDRTGEAQPGVYEQVWQETAAEHPDFVINVGDTIQGEDDNALDSQWQAIQRLLKPYARYRFFYTPGNHDVWDDLSAQAFTRYTKFPLHYGFDYGPVHCSVLDNSRTDALPAEELDWLEQDLETHPNAAAKFVFSHRPSWILNAVLQNPDFRLQRIAKKYGVKNIIAGHIHQMLHFELDGITYLSVASSGGHLRNSKRYEDGWFFQHTLVTLRNGEAQFDIKEAKAPHGEGRLSHPADWGPAGLISAERTR